MANPMMNPQTNLAGVEQSGQSELGEPVAVCAIVSSLKIKQGRVLNAIIAMRPGSRADVSEQLRCCHIPISAGLSTGPLFFHICSQFTSNFYYLNNNATLFHHGKRVP